MTTNGTSASARVRAGSARLAGTTSASSASTIGSSGAVTRASCDTANRPTLAASHAAEPRRSHAIHAPTGDQQRRVRDQVGQRARPGHRLDPQRVQREQRRAGQRRPPAPPVAVAAIEGPGDDPHQQPGVDRVQGHGQAVDARRRRRRRPTRRPAPARTAAGSGPSRGSRTPTPAAPPEAGAGAGWRRRRPDRPSSGSRAPTIGQNSAAVATASATAAPASPQIAARPRRPVGRRRRAVARSGDRGPVSPKPCRDRQGEGGGSSPQFRETLRAPARTWGRASARAGTSRRASGWPARISTRPRL